MFGERFPLLPRLDAALTVVAGSLLGEPHAGKPVVSPNLQLLPGHLPGLTESQADAGGVR